MSDCGCGVCPNCRPWTRRPAPPQPVSGPEIVEVGARAMTAEVTMPLRHLCPFADEVDEGHATLTWQVADRTVELHSLRAWLDTFANAKVSHEVLTGLLYDKLHNSGLFGVTVTTTWTTAGGTVTVRA